MTTVFIDSILLFDFSIIHCELTVKTQDMDILNKCEVAIPDQKLDSYSLV